MKTRTFIFVVILASVLLSACTKEVLKTSGKVLGERTVSAEAGDFPVLVTTTGVWTAASLSDWIKVDGDMHKDQCTILVRYGANTSYLGKNCFNRLGKVLVRTVDGAQADTLLVKQRGIAPFFYCPEVGEVPLRGGRFSVPVNSNFSDNERSRLSFRSDVEWISNISWGYDGRSIAFDVTKGETAREATIYLTFTPEWGEIFEGECPIIQK